MKTVNFENLMVNVSWCNTLQNRNFNVNHISDMAELAFKLGYPLILWNDRVYGVINTSSNDYDIKPTEYIVSDLS